MENKCSSQIAEVPTPEQTKAQQNDNATICVVGAGIVGVCTALYLQKEGFKVTIMDGSGVAQGCSKGNAGHFATEQVFPLADKSVLFQLPKMLLDPIGPFSVRLSYLLKALPWFTRFLLNMRAKKVSQHTRALKSLNRLAMDAYKPLIEESNLSHFISKKGSLLTFESDNIHIVEKQYMMFKGQGINLELLNKQQLKQLEPNLSNNINYALHFKDVAHSCDPELLCRELHHHFLTSGGEFVKANVTEIQHDKTNILIHAGNQQLAYDKVVIATGAWSKSLLKPLGYYAPLEAERGYHLMLTRHNVITRPVASADRKFIITPMNKGLRLAGTVEFAGLNTKMNKKRAHALLPHAKKILPELAQSQCKETDMWMGCRPSLPDSLPVIGNAPKHQHIYFAFGHQHLGLTQGAITGKLIAEQLTNQTPSVDLAPFCISRFN